MFCNSSLTKRLGHIAGFDALLILGCLAVATSGCSRFTRTKQCRALIAQVNPALDDVIALTHTGGAGGGAGSATGGAGGGGAGGSGGTSGSGGGGGTVSNSATSNGYVAAAGRYERLAKQLGP
ncbi:MAG TPA: hypothetical protein VHM25_01585, partial [Polyangiaceae bacterium]|nr:hypothetical protein [Polyangiaceae bacterium]